MPLEKSLALQLIEENIRTENPILDLSNCGLVDESPELKLVRKLNHVHDLSFRNFHEFEKNKSERAGESYNQFQKIPTSLSNNLGRLNLSSNQLSKIENLDQLTELDLGGNKISKIENLELLSKLTVLNLTGNVISKINNLNHLTSLVKLNLSGNLISKIENLDYLINLAILILYNNRVSKIENLNQLKILKEFNIGSNKISKIENLNHLTKLTKLVLWDNKISKIENLNHLKSLTKLGIEDNKISKIENLDQLTVLTNLSFWENKISKIENLEQLITLKELDLDENRIVKIENLEQLTELSELCLSENKISKIENLNQLTNLTELQLGGNKISKIENLKQLRSLTSLDLNDNKISKIENLESLNLLTHLSITNNPLTNFPIALASQYNCWQDYQNWQKELSSGAPFVNNQSKILVLGNGNVGKSSTIEALLSGHCSQKKESTHGVKLEQLTHPDTQHQYQTWDFGGQELFFGTHKLFMQGQSIFLLVFDSITEQLDCMPDRVNQEETTRNRNIKQWIHAIQHENPNSPIILVQNLKSEEEQEDDELKITAALMQIEFVSFNAFTGDNVDFLWMHIKRATEKKLFDYKMSIPKSWNKVRKHFFSLQEKTQALEFSISRTEFQKLASEFGVGEYAYSSLELFLVNSGIIYSNEQHLGETIIYDLRWVLDAIYLPFDRIELFYKTLRTYSKGYIEWIDLKKQWNNKYDEKHYSLILQFMKSCSVCFPLNKKDYSEIINDKDYLVFPEFLESDRPNHIDSLLNIHIDKLERIQLSCDFLPTHLIHKYISKYGNNTQKENYWYQGIFVENKNANFMIEANFETNVLDLYLEHNMSENLKDEILSMLPKNIYKEEELNSQMKREVKDLNKNSTQKNSKNTLEVVKNSNPIALDIINNNTDLEKIDKNKLSAFLSYSKYDGEECNNQQYGDGFNYLQEFKSWSKSLLNLATWDDTHLIAGEDWDDSIKEKLKEADIIFLLISQNFLNTPYVQQTELKIAFEREKKEECIVVPINIKNSTWEDHKWISKKSALPRKGKNIASMVKDDTKTKEDVWMEIYKEMKIMIESYVVN